MLQDVTVPIQGRLSLSTPVSVDLKSEALWRGGGGERPPTNQQPWSEPAGKRKSN